MNVIYINRRKITARFLIVLTFASIMISALPVAFFVANAATNLYDETNVVVDRNNSYESVLIDILDYTDLQLSLSYDAELLDNGDTFTFGWRDADGENEIQTVIGRNEGIVGDESATDTFSIIPADGVTEIQLFATVESNSDSDKVTILTISVEGEEKEVDICHWDGGVFSLLTVGVTSIGVAHGSEEVNDGDIIPAFGDYGGQNLDEMYGGQTGAEVYENNCVIIEPIVETCEDGIQNQDETGIDEGGVCGSVLENPVYGCLDESALNYNPRATQPDEESCEYEGVDEAIEEETSSRSSSGTRVRTTLPPATPQVLGVSTSSNECPLLLDFMQIGIENDPVQVKKLQLFLNIFVAPTPVTGFFGTITDSNVKKFQEQYRTEVLVPWFERGIVPHSQPTGFVYKTTIWKINDIVCPGQSIAPVFEGEDLTSNIDLD